MPHLWYIADEEWVTESLAASRALGQWTGDDATLLRIRNESRAGCGYALLAASAALRVNGDVLATGLRVLRDRDEILCPDGRRLWFSAENIAEVVPFPGAGEAGSRCPRCRKDIASGTDAVACACCGTFYHSTADKPCYDYHDQCVVCAGPTISVTEPTLGWTPCAL